MIFESEYIYEDEFDCFENQIAMEKALVDSQFSCDIMYFEADGNKQDESKFKAIIEKIITKFKEFMAKCRDYLRSAINKVTKRIDQAYTEYSLEKLLNNFQANITNAEKHGLKTFKFVNILEIANCMQDECNEYKKIIKTFSNSYIKHANPKDAEKLLNDFKKLTEKYDTRLKKAFNEIKEYPIVKAKIIKVMIDKSRKGGFLGIVDDFKSTCDEIERLTISTLNSLNKYSEDTGYIQNAKSLQEMIHNASINIQAHSSQCVTTILRYGIPAICLIGKVGSDKYDDEVLDNISHTSNTIGLIGDIAIDEKNKAMRGNDIKDWKFTKGESPLTFDNRKLTADEGKTIIKKTIPKSALVTLIKGKNIW